jgi:hypothetical protein
MVLHAGLGEKMLMVTQGKYMVFCSRTGKPEMISGCAVTD